MRRGSTSMPQNTSGKACVRNESTGSGVGGRGRSEFGRPNLPAGTRTGGRRPLVVQVPAVLADLRDVASSLSFLLHAHSDKSVIRELPRSRAHGY